jgi:uncharacterized protein YxjI
MTVIDKLTQIATLINEIKEEDSELANVLWNGFRLSMDLAKSVSDSQGKEKVDISEQLTTVCDILGIDLQALVMYILQTTNTDQGSDKPVDEKTLEFITGDLDEYEKFIAQNSAKESLDFLSKEI